MAVHQSGQQKQPLNDLGNLVTFQQQLMFLQLIL